MPWELKSLPQPVFYHVAANEAEIEDSIVSVSEGLDFYFYRISKIRTLDFLITSRHLDLRRFIANAMAKVRNRYDFIIIDCNPALSSLNISIALLPDRVRVPSKTPIQFAAKGLKKTIEEFERIGKEYGQSVHLHLLVPCMMGAKNVPKIPDRVW